MEIKIKFIDKISATFYMSFNSSSTIKEIKSKVSQKLNKTVESFVLKRGTEVLNDKLDLNLYEFGSSGVIEINYI